MAFGLFQLRSAVVGNPTSPSDVGRPGRAGLIAVWLTVIAVVLFFVVDERGLGLYRFFWSHVPGFEAIRTPYRVQTILYSMAAYLIIRSIELLWLRSRPLRSGVWPRRVLVASAAILVSLIAIEMQRPMIGRCISMAMRETRMAALATSTRRGQTPDRSGRDRNHKSSIDRMMR